MENSVRKMIQLTEFSVIKLFFFILVLLFVPFACAIEMSAPPSIYLQNTAETLNCTSLDVSVYGSDALILQNSWSAKPSKNLEDYVFSGRDIGLIVEHPEIVWVNAGSFSVPFCAVSKESGIYRGVILMQPSQSMGGIGTWIVINVSEGILRKNNLLESLRAESLDSIDYTNIFFIIGLEMMFILLCGLIIIALCYSKGPFYLVTK